jgi:hypothetical protein
MAASYPSAVKTWTPVTDGVDDVLAIHINDAYAELIAVETKLISGLTTVGTITTGTWNGTKLAVTYGGTSLTATATGGILVTTSTSTISNLAMTTNYTVLVNDSGTITWSEIMADYTANLTTNVTITAASTSSAVTWYTGVTISGVVSGVYIATSQMNIGKNTALSTLEYGRIFNSTLSSTYTSGQQCGNILAYHASTLSLHTVIHLTATSTILLQGASNTAAALILARIYTSAVGTASGDTATHMSLVRIR